MKQYHLATCHVQDNISLCELRAKYNLFTAQLQNYLIIQPYGYVTLVPSFLSIQE